MFKIGNFEETYPEVDQKAHHQRMETVRFTSWFIIVIGVSWSLLGLYIGENEVVAIAMIAMFGSVVAIFTLNTEFNLIGRSIWMFTGQIAVLAGCFVVDEAANVPMMFGAIVGGPFLVFSLLSEKKYLFFFSFSNVFYWFLTWYLGADYFDTILIGKDNAETYIELPVALTTLLIILVELGYFGLIANTYAVQMYESNRRAQAANEAKSTFLANMSHEIRTPMNGVLGLLEVLDGPEVTKDQKRILRTMRESSSSLLRIIDDILDTSKIEAGQLELNPTSVLLLPAVESIVESITPFADSKRVELNFRVNPNVPAHIMCDGGRLRQVMLNLLSNAIKFSSKEDPVYLGLVRFYVESDATHLVIRVQDNGVGIDEEELADIFKPFVQAKMGASGRFGGTGLGLTIVQQLVQKMGGDVSVTSKIGKGTEFKVRLPLAGSSGSLKAPDLCAWDVFTFIPDRGLRHYLRGYVEYAGANFHFYDDEETFCRDLGLHGNSNSVAVIALSGRSSLAMREVARRVKTLYPKQKTLTFSAHRGIIQTDEDDGYQVIHWTPLLLSEFWGALAQFAKVDFDDFSDGESGQDLPSPIELQSSQDLKILVVEDNEINQFVILEQLRKIGLKAEIANDGVDGFKKWEKGNFDLILCDCHMPRMNGFAMTEKIREAEFATLGTRTPVIAITANALLGEADQCFASGMDDYLSKPFALKDLKAAIEKWID